MYTGGFVCLGLFLHQFLAGLDSGYPYVFLPLRRCAFCMMDVYLPVGSSAPSVRTLWLKRSLHPTLHSTISILESSIRRQTVGNSIVYDSHRMQIADWFAHITRGIPQRHWVPAHWELYNARHPVYRKREGPADIAEISRSSLHTLYLVATEFSPSRL